MHIAYNTILSIERAIEADQGAAFRVNEGKVFPHMGDAYRGEESGHRTHLGASLLGGECGRELWYGFRWAQEKRFPGRTLRLFNRGHLEEARFIAMLLTIGVQVFQQDENGKQFRIAELGGHLGGSGDGVGVGLPDLQPGQPALLEFKTHSDSSFAELAGKNWKKHIDHLLDPSKPRAAFDGKGVRAAKFEHYVQMNVYMRKMGLTSALYAAVNKNDDSVYMEVVPLDVATADTFLERGRKVIMMREAPTKLSNSPGWFGCKLCDYKGICHLNEPLAVNCRTCVHSDPCEDGTWRCNVPTAPDGGGAGLVLSKEQQHAGCPQYKAVQP